MSSHRCRLGQKPSLVSSIHCFLFHFSNRTPGFSVVIGPLMPLGALVTFAFIITFHHKRYLQFYFMTLSMCCGTSQFHLNCQIYWYELVYNILLFSLLCAKSYYNAPFFITYIDNFSLFLDQSLFH